MSTATARAIDWSEQGLIPDPLIRAGIRRLLRDRLRLLAPDDYERQMELEQAFVHHMSRAPVALVPEKANEQHYEVPARFFDFVLGAHRKYSCAYWPDWIDNLDDAEAAALAMTCERAGVEDGMDVLELGCGWGSLTLWLARHYPAARITAVSNSSSQAEYIRQRAASMGYTHVQVVTADMNDFDTDRQFDRILSLEMFEHMRNWGELYRRVYTWLKPGGRFFKHIFVHRGAPYPYEDHGDDDWMTRHFFSGGMMPSDDLPLYFQHHLKLVSRWRWGGEHYRKTCNAWLANMDRNRDEIWPILSSVYGAENAQKWWMRWRMFFMACAELFGFEDGQQWWIGHYLFERPAPQSQRTPGGRL
ncbi:MAG: cyclopropane-fatty-acyl-phospholipid synthase [Acidiferrobacteraceae bacterium]|jgi:cyclopropane-fatty-acyl-phospholipid synthase